MRNTIATNMLEIYTYIIAYTAFHLLTSKRDEVIRFVQEKDPLLEISGCILYRFLHSKNNIDLGLYYFLSTFLV